MEDEHTQLSEDAKKIILDIFAPVMDTLTKEAEAEIARFDALFSADHNAIGRVLKAHLVVEQYLNEHIKNRLKMDNLAELKLTFRQKVQLLGEKTHAVVFVKPGILQLNIIRNRFSHRLSSTIEWQNISAIVSILDVASKGVKYEEPIDAIEGFASVACAFLCESPTIRRIQMEDELNKGKIKFATNVWI